MPAGIVPQPPWASGSWLTTVWEAGSWGFPVYLPISLRIDAKLDGVDWVAITGDTIAVDGLTIDYGIPGNGPFDVMAGTGVCSFTLSNLATVGKYSPAHANVTSGWGVDTPIRVVFETVEAGDIAKFVGTVQVIEPEPGEYGTKRVAVIAHDYIGHLAEARVSNITAKVNQTDKALIEAVYAALPAASQPPSTDFDDAIDTYKYAFDEVGPGDQAMALLQDVLVSAFALLVQRGDGTHRLINRESRTYTESVDTFTADDFHDLIVPSDRAAMFDGVVIEIPQIEIGAAPEVLAREVGLDADPVPAGATVVRWLEYRDPLDTASTPVRVAGTSGIVPVATTDYTFNAAADGSGANLTGSMTVTAEYFSGTAKLTMTNASGSSAYRTLLQVRGTAIRRFQPRVVTAGDISGTRVLVMRLPFQTSTTVAQFIADVLYGQYGTTLQRPTEVAIRAQQSDRLMRHALERNPGDRITLEESVTGLLADAIIHGISLSVKGPSLIEECRWVLGPQSSFLFITPWRWGIVGKSEWGETTVYG